MSEQEDRVSLRARARLVRFIQSAIDGREPSGAEAELADACGVHDEVPLELFEMRATAAAPTGGLSLDIVPAVYESSTAAMIGVSMPLVSTGRYSTATVEEGVSATGVAKGVPVEGSEVTFNVTSTAPSRISGAVEFSVEDLAQVGTDRYEVALRESLSSAMSDAIDGVALEGFKAMEVAFGAGSQYNPLPRTTFQMSEIFEMLFGPVSVDGYWARGRIDVTLLLHARDWSRASRAYVSGTGDARVIDYYGNAITSRRWSSDGDNTPVLLYRNRPGVRCAELPSWGGLQIDDVVTESARGVRRLTMHAMVGELLVRHRRAYGLGYFGESGGARLEEAGGMHLKDWFGVLPT